MPATPAPLTKSILGSRKCPGCEKPVYDGSPVTVIEGPETVVVQRRGHGYRREVVTSRRWHSACLAAFQEQNDAYREECRQDRVQMVRTIAEAAGWSEEQIAEAVAGVR